MALDQALLDAVVEDPSSAILRTYGWTEPTLSLGYFQKIDDAETDPRWRRVPIVRRPTGGGAIWHHHEVTYALVIPAIHPMARPNVTLYQAVHSAIGSLLRSQGIDASRRGPSNDSRIAGRPFLCFTDRDPEDLVSRGAKIVGSAQRRRPGAILQHGSLLLKRSPMTPELPGAADLAETPSSPGFWSELLRDHLPRALGLEPAYEELGAALLRRSDDLEREVYLNPSWNRRR
jgi:lipoate-protein ligase A